MPVNTITGLNSTDSDGSQQQADRGGRTNERIVGFAHAGNYEACARGKIYMACNQSAVTFGATLTLTGITFTLSNTLGSGVNLVLISCGVTIITAATAAGQLLYVANLAPAAAAVVHGTPLVVRNGNLALSSGQGLADGACTLPAIPTPVRTLCSMTVTAAGTIPNVRDYVNGSLIVAPGTALTIQSLTSTGTGLVDMCWEEVVI